MKKIIILSSVFILYLTNVSYANETFLNNEKKCLEKTLTGEAIGESVGGIYAVAEVILNRIFSKSFPDSTCDVVRQVSFGKIRQFEGYWKKVKNYKEEEENKIDKVIEFYFSNLIVYYDTGKKINSNLTDDALFFRNPVGSNAKTDEWFDTLIITEVIGNHYFYK